MKRSIYYFTIFVMLLISACKKEEISDQGQFPEWLQAKITELTSKQNICLITDVTISEYKGKRYYNVYCGLWSCVYCQFFDEQGNRPTWDSNGWNDFFAKQKVVKILPACQ